MISEKKKEGKIHIHTYAYIYTHMHTESYLYIAVYGVCVLILKYQLLNSEHLQRWIDLLIYLYEMWCVCVFRLCVSALVYIYILDFESLSNNAFFIA